MAVEILWDPAKQIACMWDNTTDQAFGPVFSGPSADTEVQEFMDWLRMNPPQWTIAASTTGDGTDPRHYPVDELEELVKFWCDLPTDEDGERFDPDEIAARKEDAAVERAEAAREARMFDRESWDD